jgi:hypothetical protein
MSLFRGGRLVGPALRAIPALLRGPLARQTLQFDEDRGGPLTLIAPCGAGQGAKAAILSKQNQMFTMNDDGETQLISALQCLPAKARR